MQFRTEKRTTSDDERILPLINIVFLLLIFFMLAGKLAATDPIKVDPPHSASEAAVEKRELVVIAGGDGRLAFDGALIEKTGLQAAVREKLDGGSVSEVWLKADGGANTDDIVAVMDILRQAGVEELKLLTIRADDGSGR